MKVIHIITTIENGGAEKQLLLLAKQQIKQGLNVEIWPLKGKLDLESKFNDNQIKINLIFHNKNIFRQVITAIKMRFKIGDHTIIHSHLPQGELIGRTIGNRNNYIYSRHNAENFWPNKPKIISRFLSRLITKNTRSCIAISNAVKVFLLEHKEVDAKTKIEVIHYGIEIDSNELNISKLSRNKKMNQNDHISFGIIARLVPQKNLIFLINCIKILIEKKFDCTLYIVGDGILEKKLKEYVADLGLQKNIYFQGKINDTYTFYKNIDVFLFTSNYEGFGLVLLEAMQYGVPIIAPNHSAIPEVLGKNYYGLYEPNNYEDFIEKCKEIILDPETYSNYLINQLSNFKIEKIELLIEHAYKDIVNA